MTDLVGMLCERLLEGMELDPHALAARLGTVDEAGPGLPIRVVPANPSFSAAAVSANRDSGQTSAVDLVPAGRLTLAALRESLGPYRESPRLHPSDPGKFVFSPGNDLSHPWFVLVVAYISAGERDIEAAPVQKLTIMCSPVTGEKSTPPGESVTELTAVPVWPRLLGARASFGVRSWRDATLEAVRSELEAALGVHFVPCDDKVYDGEPAFACALPACELRLSSWPSNAPNSQVFNFIALPSGGLEPDRRKAEDIGEAIAVHLRSEGCDWYVPDRLEVMEGGGVLGEGLLDRAAIVSILAPRWLAWFSGEERDGGIKLLESIADNWLSGARRTSDPIADLKRRWAEFEGWGRYVAPRSRLGTIAAYAVQEHLSMIEEELFELKEMPAAERAALQGTSARLAAWRDTVVALAEPVMHTRINSIRRQHEEVLASIDELTEILRDSSDR